MNCVYFLSLSLPLSCCERERDRERETERDRQTERDREREKPPPKLMYRFAPNFVCKISHGFMGIFAIFGHSKIYPLFSKSTD